LLLLSSLPNWIFGFGNLPSPHIDQITTQLTPPRQTRQAKKKGKKKSVQYNFRGTWVNGSKKAARNSQASTEKEKKKRHSRTSPP